MSTDDRKAKEAEKREIDHVISVLKKRSDTLGRELGTVSTESKLPFNDQMNLLNRRRKRAFTTK